MEHISFNSKKGLIEGLQDLGTERWNKVANYVIVFSVQGIVKRFKQPLAFYFTNGGAISNLVQSMLKDVLSECYKNDILILATVCDMGSSNVKALNDLGCTTSDFLGNRIIALFDVPHLLKSVRNNFIKYNVEIPTNDVFQSIDTSETYMTAKWPHIKFK